MHKVKKTAFRSNKNGQKNFGWITIYVAGTAITQSGPQNFWTLNPIS